MTTTIDYNSIRFGTLTLLALVVLTTSISTQAWTRTSPYELCPDTERTRPPACVTVQESETRIVATSACKKLVAVTADVVSRESGVSTQEHSAHIFLYSGETATVELTDIVTGMAVVIPNITDKRLGFTKVKCCPSFRATANNPSGVEACPGDDNEILFLPE